MHSRKSLDPDILLGLVFDYYFGLTSPAEAKYSASGARVILYLYTQETRQQDPVPCLDEIIARRGEKNVVDRYIQLAGQAGKGQVLDSESSWTLLAHLLKVRSTHERLLHQSKVHVSAMKTFWNESRSLPGDSRRCENVARGVLVPTA